jgi:hypothetical protein
MRDMSRARERALYPIDGWGGHLHGAGLTRGGRAIFGMLVSLLRPPSP